jgi:outer membrane murein-binding lipoprotein Lpp
MDKAVKFWGSLAAAMGTTLLLASFVSDARASAAVRPLESRVSVLEAQRAEDVKRLDEIRSDVKTLLDRVPPRP